MPLRFVSTPQSWLLVATIIPLLNWSPLASAQTSPTVQPITAGHYAYSVSPQEEGRDGTVLTFAEGRLTGTPSQGVQWPGQANGERQISVVFDLAGDVALQKIVLESSEPTKTERIDAIEVQCRSTSDSAYRVVLPERSTKLNPWTTLEIPLDGKPTRYVRIKLKRLHTFVRMSLKSAVFLSKDESPRATTPPGSLTREFTIDPVLVDTYGQYLYENWPGKITSPADFQRDREEEAKRLDRPEQLPALDSFGGYINGPALRKTGFFRLEKIDGRWWFITPEGNPFFLNGLDCAAFNEWGYSTSLTNAKGEIRGVFAELPDRSQFPKAYFSHESDRRVSFLIANLQRKYGSDFKPAWNAVTRQRLINWGFNANAKWTRDEALGLPFITVLRPSKNARRIKWACDPYAPDFPTQVETEVAPALATLRDNPSVIGHTFENEKGWDLEVIAAMLKSTPAPAAKEAFIDFLLSRNNDDIKAVAALFGIKDASRRSLLQTALPLKKTLQPLAREFILEASRRYYKITSEIIRRHDPNHLLLGSSLTPGWHSSFEWESGAVGYVDALSLDNYKEDSEWITPYLKFDLPIVLLEYSFVVNARGMGSFHSMVNTQRDRGIAYRHLMENLAVIPQFVGAGWFALYDQSACGRNIGGGGENHNFGIINQQDQPYDEVIAEMQKTSRRLFDLHAGKIPPFDKKTDGGK